MVDMLVEVSPIRPATTRRIVLLRVVAIMSALAAVIHFAVSGEHFGEYWLFGVFMVVVAWLQLAWAAGLVVRPSRMLLGLGAAVNASVIAIYVVTRTVGDVLGPTPHEVEPVGFGDACCTVVELTAVSAAVLLLVCPLRRPVQPRRAGRALAATGLLAAVLLSVSLLDGGPEMVMTMTAEPTGTSGESINVPTDSPAGPVTMPEPGMQMAPGMRMAGSPCTTAPSAAQESAAADLVDTTWADAKKYRSLAVATAAGYQPMTPTGRAVVHYINPANYRATVRGGPVIAPSAPQSLVYANTPHGAVLVAVMYISSPQDRAALPDPGGCLTQWHVHTNLCFAGSTVVGVAHPTCPAGAVNRTTPPMLHIWFIPIPGGPTAVDATNAQIVHAAEQVTGPHNPVA